VRGVRGGELLGSRWSDQRPGQEMIVNKTVIHHETLPQNRRFLSNTSVTRQG